MSTRLKRFLHIKTDDRQELDSISPQSLELPQPFGRSASIPTSPYSIASSNNPPFTSTTDTPISSPITEDPRADSVVSCVPHIRRSSTGYFHLEGPRPSSISSFISKTGSPCDPFGIVDRPDSPALPARLTPVELKRLSVIRFGPDLSAELRDWILPDEEFHPTTNTTGRLTRKPTVRRGFTPNRGARYANIPFFQNQQQYAELIASRKALLPKSTHPALRNRSQTGPEPPETLKVSDTPPPIPKRDSSRPRYPSSNSLREPRPRTKSTSNPNLTRATTSAHLKVPSSKSSTNLSHSRSAFFHSQEPSHRHYNFSRPTMSSTATTTITDPALFSQLGITRINARDDATLHTKISPAVTHEVIQPIVHHVRHEQLEITTHVHAQHTRILPVTDVQVLPPRHYVPASALQALGATPVIPPRVGSLSQGSLNSSPKLSSSGDGRHHVLLPLPEQVRQMQGEHDALQLSAHPQRQSTHVYLNDEGHEVAPMSEAEFFAQPLVEIDPRSLAPAAPAVPDRTSSIGQVSAANGVLDSKRSSLHDSSSSDRYASHPTVLDAVAAKTPLPLLTPLPYNFKESDPVGQTAASTNGTETIGTENAKQCEHREWVGADGVRRSWTEWLHGAVVNPAVREDDLGVNGLGMERLSIGV